MFLTALHLFWLLYSVTLHCNWGCGAFVHRSGLLWIRTRYTEWIRNVELRFTEYLSKRTAGSLPLHYFSSSKKSASDISFANTEPSLSNREDIIRKFVIKKQLAGHINKSANRNKFEYRSFMICEPCEFQSTVVSTFNTHSCSDQHFYLFAQNNFNLVCTFCKLQEDKHNFNRHLPSKRHSKNLKSILRKSN